MSRFARWIAATTAALSCIGVLIALAIPAHAQGSAVSAVTTESTPSYEVVPGRQPVPIKVPLELDPTVDPTSLNATLSDVRRSDNISAAVQPYFNATITQQTLLITVQFQLPKPTNVGPLPPGTYTVDTLVTWQVAGSNPVAHAQTAMAVKIVVPSATLVTSGPITVTVTGNCLVWCISTPHRDASKLVIDETSQTAGVIALRGANRNVTRGADPASGPLVTLHGKPASLRAGEQNRSIAYDVSNDFAVGKTTGTLRLASPSLSSPVDVSWTVHVRRGPLPYLLIIVLGMLIGWLVRIGLTSIVDRGDRKQQVDDRIAFMRVEIARHKDAVFCARVQEIANELDAKAVQSGYKKDSDINGFITTANLELDDATKALDARRSLFDDLLHDTRRDLASEGPFVGILGPELSTATTELAKVLTLRNDDNIQAADDLLATQITAATTQLGATASAWRSAVQPLISALTTSADAIPKRADSAVTTTVSGLTTALNAAEFGQPTSIRTSEAAVSAALAKLGDLITVGLGALVTVANDINASLHDRGIDIGRDQLANAIHDLDAQITASDGDPASIELPSLTSNVSNMLHALPAFFRQQHCADATKSDDYDTAIREGRYDDAIAMLPTVRAAAAPTPVAVRILGAELPPARQLAVTPGAHEPLNLPVPARLAPLSAIRGPSRALSTGARALRWAIAALILAISAAVVLPQTIDGTTTQLIGVFIWAFSLNLAFNGLIDQTAKYGLAPPAPPPLA